MDLIFASLWFFLPAGLGNGAPIIAARLPVLRRWNQPIDFNICWSGQRLLGAHKTWRGLAAGVIAATVTLALQQWIMVRLPILQDSLRIIPGYDTMPALVLGPLLGAGALIGDMVESFFKRRRGVHPGGSWFPFDQIDYILGASLFSVIVIRLPLAVYLTSLFLWLLIHLIAAYIGYLLGLKDKPI